jgi:hypothetical protein
MNTGKATPSTTPQATIKGPAWRVVVSEALAGELLGLAEIDSDRWLVRFADVELGTIDRTAPRTLRRAERKRCAPSPAPVLQPTAKLSPIYPVQTVTYESGCTRERPFFAPAGGGGA